MIRISGNHITASVSEHGAELTSIVCNGTEYLWQADPEYWKRHAPVLFPIVGSLRNGECTIDGRKYAMPQHGFARDMDFRLVSQDCSSVSFVLESDSETEKLYPYRFRLVISYRIEGKSIHVNWAVENTDSCNMLFQIGGHPAFNYPGFQKGPHTKGFFRFDNPDARYILLSDTEKGCADPDKVYEMKLDEGLLPVCENTFRNNALIFENGQIRSTTLLTTERIPWITVTSEAPVLGLWSPYGKDAPFVCIEPWYGRCDRAGADGDFSHKDWINRLSPGKTFHGGYTITIEQ